MAEISLSRDAHFDLLEIWTFIARHDLAAADRLAERFDRVFQTLVASPHLGRAAPRLHPRLRVLPQGDYLIFYRAEAAGVQIARVLHGAREITPALFE